jgi:hypothetical protein
LGNIGYIDLRRFYGIDIAAATVISAINLVVNTDTLIFYFRKNGGKAKNVPYTTIAFL